MAQSWISKQKQFQVEMDRRLENDMLTLAQKIGAQIQRAATDRNEAGQAIVPTGRAVRERLKDQIWNQTLRPYFIGAGDEPLIGPEPQSDYMRLIRDGVRGQIAIQLDRQISIIRKYADDRIFNYLTGPRPFTIERQMQSPPLTPPHFVERGIIKEIGGVARVMTYDPFHLFVYGDQPYRLSDRGWQTGIESRKAIDALIDQHVPLGTAAVDLADMLVPYLWPEAAKVKTRTPYGEVGSYWGRRLARTEITAAAGRSLINYSAGNLYIDEIDWVLSHRHRPQDFDICDERAANGPYKKNEVPLYPAHPHDQCNLQPRVSKTPAQVTAQLNQMLNAPIQFPQIRRMQGAFNPVWAVGAMLVGAWIADVLGDSQENAA